jgi:hypothetical protein
MYGVWGEIRGTTPRGLNQASFGEYIHGVLDESSLKTVAYFHTFNHTNIFVLDFYHIPNFVFRFNIYIQLTFLKKLTI